MSHSETSDSVDRAARLVMEWCDAYRCHIDPAPLETLVHMIANELERDAIRCSES